MRIIKQVYSVLLLLIILSGVVLGADADTLITQYFDKTVEQLSGLSAAGIKPTKDWFETQIFTPLKALTDRVQTERNLKDYDDPDDAVVSGYGAFVPSGTITITQTGDQNADAISMENNTTLTGTGLGSVLMGVKTTASEALALCKIDADTNVIISGIKFVHDTTGVSSYGLEYDALLTIIGGSKNILIYNCDFTPLGDGVYIGGPSDSTNFPENVIVAFCKFHGDSLAGYNQPTARNGISVTGGNNIILIGNDLDGFHNVGSIDIEPNKANILSNIIVANNTLYARGWGITVAGSALKNVNISNNLIDGSQYNNCQGGVHVAAHAYSTRYIYENINISDNVIYGISDDTYAGIYIGGLNTGINITGNTIAECDCDGIKVNPLSKGLNITNNRIVRNDKYGINLFQVSSDSTTTAITDANMNDDDAAWISIGTPTTNDTSSAYVLADSVSRKIVTDAVNEGLGQVLSTGLGSAPTIYEAIAYVFIETAGTMTRNVSMTVGGAVNVWSQNAITGPNSQDGRGWTPLHCWFIPSGTDTLKVTAALGTTTFYVDSVKIYARHGHLNTNITGNYIADNNAVNSTWSGLYAGSLLNANIQNNTIVSVDTSLTDTTTHYYGMYLYNIARSRILNNTINGSTSSDLYLRNITSSDISFIGIDSPFWLTTSTAYDVRFPYAKAMYFYEDSVATTRSAAPMDNGSTGWNVRYPMPSSGRIVSMAAAFSDSVTAGTATFYPQIGFQVSGNISTRTYLYGVVTGSATQKVQYVTVPLMTTDYVKFNAGDFVGVSLSTDGSFAPDGTRTASAILMWE